MILSATVSFAVNRDFNKADTIRIGVLAPVQMSPGQGIVNPAKMAAEEINAAGGVGGKKIEIVLGDTENKPEKGLTAFKKLVLEDKVDVVVGEYNSGVALAIQPFLSNYQVVFVATGTASMDLTGNVEKNYEKNKYFFRAMINSDRQMQYIFRFVKEYAHDKLGYNKIAVLAENASWTKDFSTTLKQKLEDAGMQVVFNERFDVDMKDFSPIFNNIKSSGAEWIIQVVSHGASIPLVKAWQESQPAPMGGVHVASMDHEFWGVTGGACLYECTHNMLARAPLTDKTIPFWDKYVKQFGTNPVYDTGWTYDAIYMVAKVIGEKKSLKTEDIIKGLEDVDFHGVLHPHMAFDKHSHDVMEGRFTMVIVQWQKDGNQVVVFPEEFKTGEYIKPVWWHK
jgi:branched-chain amino acid transport system substrate-binding protein